MSKSEPIYTYLKSIIDKEDFVEYDIKFPGQSNKGDGYLSNVIFITVTGKTKNEERRILNLVAKISASSKSVRQRLPIKDIFQKEIYIYDEVIPGFKDFQNKMGVENEMLNFLSKCYLTVKSENQEFIILENLKSQKFDLWNKLKPMPYDHMKLVLEAYGKWHAFSFAMKKKRPEMFVKIVEANKFSMWPHWVFQVKLKNILLRFVDNIRNVWKNEEEIANNLNFTVDDVEYIFTKLYFEDPDHQVIIHGDCWTNNFMFQYEKDTETPLNICFLDWQMSGMATPVTDLSYFIYTCVDTAIYKDVRDLLDIYYRSLSDCLLQLGCGTEVFPYDTLIDHWQRFSRYGIILGTFVSKFSHAEGDEAPDFAEMIESGRDISEILDFRIDKNEKQYHNRVRDNFLHYIRNLSLTLR